MSFDTTISTTLRLTGAEAYIAGLTAARNATKAMDGTKATLTIDDGAAKAKVAGVASEVQKLNAAKAQPRVSVQGAEQAATSLGKVNEQVRNLQKAAVLAGEIAAIGVGLQKIVEPAANVQQNLKDIQILSGATAGEITKLDAASRTFTDMGVGAGAATAAMVELTRAGVSAADSASIARDAIALGTAGQIDAASAANALTNTMHAFNLANSESTRVSNLYAGAANASSATTQDLVAAMAQAGQAASAMGQSVDDTLTTLAIFADRGLKGSDAGTSLRTMMLRLVPQSKQAKDAMQELGLSFVDASGKVLPMAQIAQQLQDKLINLSEAQRTQALQTIFGTDAFRAANILVQQGAAAYTKYGEAINRTSAQDVATQRMQTLQGATAKLRAEWENTRVTFGTAMIPAITQLANGLTMLSSAAEHLPAPLVQAVAEFILLGAAIKTLSLAGGIFELLTGGMTALTAATTADTVAVEANNAARLAGSKLGPLGAAVPIIGGAIVGKAIADSTTVPLADKILRDKGTNAQSVTDAKELLNNLYGDPDSAGAKIAAQNYIDQINQSIQDAQKNKQAAGTANFGDDVTSGPTGILSYIGKKTGLINKDEQYDSEIANLEKVKQAMQDYLDVRNNTVEAGPPLPPGFTDTTQSATKSIEELKQESQDAQDKIKQMGDALGLATKAAASVDATKGFAGIEKATPAIREAATALASLGIKDVGLDKLREMSEALSQINADLESASAAFNGFQAQASATDQSIGVINSYKKGLDEVYEAAKKAKSAGVATPDQLELISKYTAIVGNLDSMVQKLEANKAGDFLGMAKNFPDLIKYDERLRQLTQRFGGAAAIQIEIQFRVNEALAQQQADNVISGIKDKTAPLYETITLAVQGDAEAKAALDRIRAGEDAIPERKDVQVVARALGITDLDTMAGIINGINSKHVDITATVMVTGGGLPALNIPAPGGLDPARGYASGGLVTGDYAIVGDAPGGRLTNYSEVVDFRNRRVYSNQQASYMGLFGMGIRRKAQGDGGGPGGIPQGKIDITQPGVVAGYYGGPGSGIIPVGPVDPVKVQTGTKAVQEQTEAVVQEKDKLIDATGAAAALAERIAGLDASGVQAVANAFQTVYDWAKKANEAAIIKTSGKDSGPQNEAATVAADNAAASQAVDYAVAYAQALDQARDPTADLSQAFDQMRKDGPPMVENQIRWLSIQREIYISQQKITDLQAKGVELEAAHTAATKATQAAVEGVQKAQAAEQEAEQAAARERDRTNTREGWARDQQRTQAQRTYDEATRNRTQAETDLQRKWAAQATQASVDKGIRDAAWVTEQRREQAAATAADQAWTLEQRQFADRRTALERYGTDEKQQLDAQKTALDELHKTQAGQLGAQAQLTSALAQAATDSTSRVGLSLQSALVNQAKDEEQSRYDAAIAANKAAADAEAIRQAKVLADLQDEETEATRKHEDEVARIAAENLARAQAHDDEETRIATAAAAAEVSHQLILQAMTDADARREAAHQRELEIQSDNDKAREHAYQEESWRIEDTNRSIAAGYKKQLDDLAATQKATDERYETDKAANDQAIKDEQKKLETYHEQQQYLDNILSLWNTLYGVAGETANRILSVLQGTGTGAGTRSTSGAGAGGISGTYVRPLGAASGGTGVTGLFKAGERGEEWLYAQHPVNVMPHMAVEAVKASATSGGASIGQIGPFIAAAGETWQQFSDRVLGVVRPWWEENASPSAVADGIGMR